MNFIKENPRSASKEGITIIKHARENTRENENFGGFKTKIVSDILNPSA